MSELYAESATVSGAWACVVRVPLTSFERVRAELTMLAKTGWPVAACVLDGVGEDVRQILFFRDPSRKFGAPSADSCDAAMDDLAAVTGWIPQPSAVRADGVLIALGLREGYTPDAPTHSLHEVNQLFLAHGEDLVMRDVRLVSARLVENEVRWYDEPGVMAHAKTVPPSATAVAASLAQQRFIVLDLAGSRTYALDRRRAAQ